MYTVQDSGKRVLGLSWVWPLLKVPVTVLRGAIGLRDLYIHICVCIRLPIRY